MARILGILTQAKRSLRVLCASSKVVGRESLKLAPCQTFTCQTLARLLNYICRYEQPKLLQPGRNPLLFACLLQKVEEDDRLPIDYESHALTI